MDYLSLIGAVGGVIAAIYAGMTYHHMWAAEQPTVHTRLSVEADGIYLLILEIYPGRSATAYDRISVKPGVLARVRSEYKGGHAKYLPAHDWTSSCEISVDVPSSVARDGPIEEYFLLKAEHDATISLCNSKRRRAKTIKLTVRLNNAKA